MTKDEDRAVRRTVRIIRYVDEIGNISKACRYFGIPRSLFYVWRNVFRISGEEWLRCEKPIPENQPNQTPAEVSEKILWRYVVKNGVHRFKQRVDLHSIAAKIVQAIHSLIFAAYAVGYKRSRYIR